jgi:uncharacterized MAPEG superfamily protein
MNCVENLGVFGAIVFCATVAGADGRWSDIFAVAVVVSRVCQTLVHVSLAPSNVTASIRFTFFLIQAMAMLAMAVTVGISAAAV